MKCSYCGHDITAHRTLKRHLPTKCHIAKVDYCGEVIAKCPCKKFIESLNAKKEDEK